jgi:hypothetical protein
MFSTKSFPFVPDSFDGDRGIYSKIPSSFLGADVAQTSNSFNDLKYGGLAPAGVDFATKGMVSL